jgi:hypothetical protein
VFSNQYGGEMNKEYNFKGDSGNMLTMGIFQYVLASLPVTFLYNYLAYNAEGSNWKFAMFAIYLFIILFLSLYIPRANFGRNFKINVVFFLFAGIYLVYSSLAAQAIFHASSTQVLSNSRIIEILIDPVKVYEITRTMEHLSWFNNKFYYVMIVESIVLFTITFIVGIFSVKKVVYCEWCRNWADLSDESLYFESPSDEQVDHIKNGQIDTLLDLEVVRNINIDKKLNAIVTRCESCNRTSTIKVGLVIYEKVDENQDNKQDEIDHEEELDDEDEMYTEEDKFLEGWNCYIDEVRAEYILTHDQIDKLKKIGLEDFYSQRNFRK